METWPKAHAETEVESGHMETWPKAQTLRAEEPVVVIETVHEVVHVEPPAPVELAPVEPVPPVIEVVHEEVPPPPPEI